MERKDMALGPSLILGHIFLSSWKYHSSCLTNLLLCTSYPRFSVVIFLN